MQGLGLDDVDLSAQQVLQILNECDVIEQAPAGIEIDQEVQIAVGLSLTSGYRTEYAYVARAVLLRDTHDLIAVCSYA